MERSAGVIMHIASLPGKFGIGTFGKEAYESRIIEMKFRSRYFWYYRNINQTKGVSYAVGRSC